MPVERYLVTIDRPPAMSTEDMEQYIEDAVRSHKGGFEKDDPMFCHPMEELNVHRQVRRPAQQQEQCQPTPWGAVALSQFPKKPKE